MFSNLIESSSHAREFKRRGSFVLFTGVTYVVLFVAAGVASIYAYDARLEEPDNIVVTMLPPTELPAAPAPAHNPAPPHQVNGGSGEIIRQVAMANVNNPTSVPEHTSATPNTNLPVPLSGRWRLGSTDSGPLIAGGSDRFGDGSGSGPSSRPIAINVGTPPPPEVPVHKTPPPRTVSKGVITGLAIYLPKPLYPSLAKQAHVQGAVTVQVLVDESGRVVSAKAVAGHPLLLLAAQQAAVQAKFSPTKLGDQPVKVSGVITYNFLLNN